MFPNAKNKVRWMVDAKYFGAYSVLLNSTFNNSTTGNMQEENEGGNLIFGKS